MVDDFDTLATTAQASGSRDDMQRLWAAVYALDQWHFVARGAGQQIQPFIGVAEGRPMLMAFTDRGRAHAFAQANGLADESGAVSVLSIAVHGCVEMAADFARQGVFGILFNMRDQGFFAPLGNLVPMWNYLRGPGAGA